MGLSGGESAEDNLLVKETAVDDRVSAVGAVELDGFGLLVNDEDLEGVIAGDASRLCNAVNEVVFRIGERVTELAAEVDFGGVEFGHLLAPI
jgi:hypothetical protein